jgi:hypothetical protein
MRRNVNTFKGTGRSGLEPDPAELAEPAAREDG